MNPDKYRQELQAAFDGLLEKLEGARYGSFSVTVKIHDAQLREIDIHTSEKLRITEPRG